MFPEIRDNKLNQNTFTKISKSILIVELCFYDPSDKAEDLFVNPYTDFAIKNVVNNIPFTKHIDPSDFTLGFTQISRNAIITDQTEFPQLQKFLEQNGYKNGDEKNILQNIKLAPFLIAANLAHNIKMYQKHNIPINAETLFYGYNPNVYRHKNDIQEKNLMTQDECKNSGETAQNFEKLILPDKAIVEKSDHVSKCLQVMNQL